jgi:general secretion pathway protein E
VQALSGSGVEELGAALLRERLIDELALRRARRAAEKSGERLDTVLSRLGLVADRDLARIMAETLGFALVGAGDFPAAALLAELLPQAFLARAKLLPIALTESELTVAMADPLNQDAVNSVAFLTGRTVRCCVATHADFDAALARLYATGKADTGAETFAADADGLASDDIERLRDIASEAPVIRFVNEIVAKAVEAHASDIHFEPTEESVRVRFRLDGELQLVETLPAGMRAAVISRVKIMARLNIAERRLPQDGRIKLAVRGRDVDFRVSTMPLLHGEGVVMRILDRGNVQLNFPALGFRPDLAEGFARLLKQPNGIILVTGPTGSGKTTTLYAALSLLNKIESKIFTVEDPIEYQLTGINQIQVHPKVGLTFASALRSILRQDPDIVMVGEIRDLETAQIAIQASLTGHLVLSTLHTNSAASSVTRLIDMGVEPYLLASTLTGVLAQRLVRRLCQTCAKPRPVTNAYFDSLNVSSELMDRMLGAKPARLREPVGCSDCRQTGYSGRTSVMELLVLEPSVRDLVLGRSSERAIEAAAAATGMRTLYQDGLWRALSGETTIEEVLSVARSDLGPLE